MPNAMLEKSHASDNRNRLCKALDALSDQGITNARVARKIGMHPTSLYRLKVETGDANYKVGLALSAVETNYESYITWDESANDYRRHREKPLPDAKLNLEVTENYDNYVAISEEIQKNNCQVARILDTWLPFVNNEGVRYLREWIEHTGSELQILLLHPHSEALRLRIAGLPGKRLQRVREELVENLKIILDECGKSKSKCKVEVRLYDQVPAINAYLLDDTVHFGHFLMGGYSQDHFFIHTEDNFIVRDVAAHFEAVWKHPSTVRVTRAKIKALESWVAYREPEPEPNPVLRQFAGAGPFALFYPERYPHNLTELREHDFLNAIGKGIFTVSPDTRNEKNFIARLKTSEIETLEGPVIVTQVREIHYLNCILALPSRRDIQLNLLIRVSRRFPYERNQLMTGMYNIVYLNQNLGCGLLALRHDPGAGPAILNTMPAAADPGLTALLHPALIFKDSSSLIWNREHNPFSHTGVYDVFTYGRQRHDGVETKCVIRSMIRIYVNSYAEFKGLFPHGKANGKVHLILNNLYIDLKNSSQEHTRDRRGLFIIATREDGPAPDDVYGGVYAGLGAADRLPLAKRAIVRFLGAGDEAIQQFHTFEQGRRIRMFSEEFDALPAAIRGTLTGRLTNYIGFQLFNRRFISVEQLADLNKIELPLAQFFLESALYRLKDTQRKYRVNEIIQPLRQAVMHGLRDLGQFEITLKGTALEDQIRQAAEYQNLKKVL